LRQLPHGGFSKFVLPIGGSELMNAILQRANVFILTAFAGAPTVAVFAAAEELGRSVAGIRYAFDSVAGPMMAESLRLGDVERLRYNLQLMTRWVTSAAAPIAAVLLALRPVLLWLYGPDYRVGTNAMTLLIIGHLVNGVLGLSGYVLVMSGRSGLFFWNNFGAAALNVVLALVLVPRYGVTGAAIASLVGVTALAFGAAVLIRQIPLPPLPRVVLVIAAAVVVYPAALLALRPGEEERRFVLRLLQKLFRGNRQPPGSLDR
jgi:O-antigen/teichoic acid export membrane protein